MEKIIKDIKAGDTNNKEKLNGRTGLHGELLQGDAEYHRLDKDWDDLFARAKDAPAFLSRPWIQTFIDRKRFKGNPCLIAVWFDTKLVALLPFSVHNIFGVRISEPIGTIIPSYLGILLDPNYPEAISAAAEVWSQTKVAHAFYNKYLSSLDEFTNKLITEFASHGFVFKRGFTRPCPWIDLPSSFEEYLHKTKSGKRIKKLRYAQRQALKTAKVEIFHFIGKNISPEINKRIAVIQEDSWMKQRGAAVLGQPFYQELLNTIAREDLAHMWLMTIDGDDAVFSYVLAAHNKLNLKWMAFKQKYKSSLSFGKILTMQVIRDACTAQMKSLDLGFGNSNWKHLWATDKHNVERIIVGRGVLGHLAVVCYSTVWWLAENKRLFSVYSRLRRWHLLRKHRQHATQKNIS